MTTPGDLDRPGDAAATLAIRMRACEATERARELRAERAALEQILDSQRADDRRIESRLRAIQQQSASLQIQIAGARRRAAEADAQIEALTAEVDLLALDGSVSQRRERALSVAAGTLERSLVRRHEDARAAEQVLDGLRQRLAAVETKIANRATAGGGARERRS